MPARSGPYKTIQLPLGEAVTLIVARARPKRGSKVPGRDERESKGSQEQSQKDRIRKELQKKQLEATRESAKEESKVELHSVERIDFEELTCGEIESGGIERLLEWARIYALSLLSSGVGLVSPEAGVSFSPTATTAAEKCSQLQMLLRETVATEEAFIKSLKIISSYFVEPLVVKCSTLGVTCSPLLTMELIMLQMQSDHEEGLSVLSQDLSVESYLLAMNVILATSFWGQYSCCVEQVLHLLTHRVPPFEADYVRHLQRFLELHQPTEQNLDLSIRLLLLKPFGRIAKYLLFLASISKLVNGQAVEATRARLMKIEGDVGTWNAKFVEVDSMFKTVAFGQSFTPHPHFYGTIKHTEQVHVGWRAVGKKERINTKVELCTLWLFDRHVVLAKQKWLQKQVLFVIPLLHCQYIPNPTVNSVGGLYCTGNAAKLLFEKNMCTYEVLIANMLSSSVELPQAALQMHGKSNADCYMGPKVAPFDVSLHSPTFCRDRMVCYFRQVCKIDLPTGAESPPR